MSHQVNPSSLLKYLIEISSKYVPFQDRLNGANDTTSSNHRRVFHLASFKVIKRDSLAIFPYRGLAKILPERRIDFTGGSNLTCEALEGIVKDFKDRPFVFSKKLYSIDLWYMMCKSLFKGTEMYSTLEYSLKNIEESYPFLSVDIAAVYKKKLDHSLFFVEVSREHCPGAGISHKDEDKLAHIMGSSLMKLFNNYHNEGKEFLSRLEINGILAAATDFDACKLYPVFTSDDPENIDDFYFLFETRRFHILQPTENEDMNESIIAQSKIIDDDERENYIVFMNYEINAESLQMIQNIGDRVVNQALMLDGKEANPNSKYKYDDKYSKKMTSGRSSHSSSPRNTKRAKMGLSVPKKVLFKVAKKFDVEKLKAESTGIDSNIIEVGEKENLNVYSVLKKLSRYELEIYNNDLISSSNYFPKLIHHQFLEKDGEKFINLHLEEIITLSKFKFREEKHLNEQEFSVFIAKLLVDLFGGAKTLHSSGYVHGDITPKNVGYNQRLKLWQIFDFDNSRPLDEAKNQIGKYHGTRLYMSKSYLKSGKYQPFDDIIGIVLTCKNELERFTSEENSKAWMIFEPLFDALLENRSNRKLDHYFLMATGILSDLTDHNDPSLKAALSMLSPFIRQLKQANM